MKFFIPTLLTVFFSLNFASTSYASTAVSKNISAVAQSGGWVGDCWGYPSLPSIEDAKTKALSKATRQCLGLNGNVTEVKGTFSLGCSEMNYCQNRYTVCEAEAIVKCETIIAENIDADIYNLGIMLKDSQNQAYQTAKAVIDGTLDKTCYMLSRKGIAGTLTYEQSMEKCKL